jgi:uncharacterized Fe-S cluster-containing radical SAM superfamily enzyme
MTIIHSGDLEEGDEILARVIHNKDNIYLARPTT